MTADELLEGGKAQTADSLMKASPKPEAPRGEGDKIERPTSAESVQQGIFGAGQPKPLTTLQKVGNAVLPGAATAPLIAAGGAALPAAPIVGEALVAGSLGGAKSASKGESPLWGAFVDALTSAGWGGALKYAPSVKIPYTGMPSLGDLNARKTAYEAVAPKIEAAFNAIKSRLPDTKWMKVPAIGSQKLTPRQAIDKLKTLEGVDFQQARQEIIAEFERKATYAGEAMKLRSPSDRFAPPRSLMQRVAETVVPAARGQNTAGRAVRAGVEAEAVGEDVGGPSHLPIGAIPAIAARSGAEGFGNIARAVTRLAR